MVRIFLRWTTTPTGFALLSVQSVSIAFLKIVVFIICKCSPTNISPRFFTYNTLTKSELIQKLIPSQLLRNAGTGLVASIVADTTVNAIRVVKTTKQAMGSKQNASYADTIRMILAADGWKGLFGRGLRTRILANALQSMIFTVIWRALADRWQSSKNDDDQVAAAHEKE